MVPLLCSAVSWTVLQGYINCIGEALPQLRLCSAGCVDAGSGLRLGAVDLLGEETNLAGHQGVVSVAVSTVKGACD